MVNICLYFCYFSGKKDWNIDDELRLTKKLKKKIKENLKSLKLLVVAVFLRFDFGDR